MLLDHLDLDARLARADLVITAEGALDRQTPRGKIPAEVARRAKLFGRPVLALAGTIGDGAHRVRGSGVDAYSGILPAPVGPAEAFSRGGEFLADATERALRMVLIGTGLAPLDASGTAAPDERSLVTADLPAGGQIHPLRAATTPAWKRFAVPRSVWRWLMRRRMVRTDQPSWRDRHRPPRHRGQRLRA